MSFQVLIGTIDSPLLLLSEVMEMTLLGRWEPVSQGPEECRLLSNCQKSSYNPGPDLFWIFRLHFGIWAIRVFFEPNIQIITLKRIVRFCLLLCFVCFQTAIRFFFTPLYSYKRRGCDPKAECLLYKHAWTLSPETCSYQCVLAQTKTSRPNNNTSFKL